MIFLYGSTHFKLNLIMILFHIFSAQLSLTCPPSTVTTASGQTGSTVTFSQQVVTGGTGPLGTVMCNPMSGTFFDIGTHMITCTVTDAASATAMCTFNVQVNPCK